MVNWNHPGFLRPIVFPVPDLQQLVFQLLLHFCHFRFGGLPLGPSVGLDFHHVIQGLNELGVGLFQGFQIDDAPFRLFGGFRGGQAKLLGVGFEQCVGHVIDLPLGLGRFRGMGDTQGKNHLVFPQRNGVYQGGLNFLHHHSVVVLDHADLRSGLDGDGAGQFQVIDFLFKPVAFFGQVPGGLGILGKACPLGGGFQLP